MPRNSPIPIAMRTAASGFRLIADSNSALVLRMWPRVCYGTRKTVSCAIERVAATNTYGLSLFADKAGHGRAKLGDVVTEGASSAAMSAVSASILLFDKMLSHRCASTPPRWMRLSADGRLETRLRHGNRDAFYETLPPNSLNGARVQAT